MAGVEIGVFYSLVRRHKSDLREIRLPDSSHSLTVWSQRVVTLFCLLRRKQRYGKHASWQRPNDAESSSQACQRSKEKTSVLAQRYELSRTTVTKWRTRTTTADAPMGPSQPKSTVLSPAGRGSHRRVQKKNATAAG